MTIVNLILKKICDLTEYVSGIILCLIAAIVFINVMLRNLLNTPILGTNEIVQYGTMLAICFGLAQVTMHEGHVKVTIFVDKFKLKTRKIIAILIDFISFVGFTMFFYSMTGTTIKVMSSGHITPIFRIPFYIVNIVIMAGVGLMVLVFIIKVIRRIEELSLTAPI